MPKSYKKRAKTLQKVANCNKTELNWFQFRLKIVLNDLKIEKSPTKIPQKPT